jgi:hypothetical protein
MENDVLTSAKDVLTAKLRFSVSSRPVHSKIGYLP